MIQSYHNTNKETGAELAQSQNKAMTQEEAVESIFLTKEWLDSTTELTPSDVWVVYDMEYKENTPMTSIRRAISNLTKKGKLVKTDKMKDGYYGKQEHCWRLPNDEDKQLKLL